MEARYDKDQILALYLNQVFLDGVASTSAPGPAPFAGRTTTPGLVPAEYVNPMRTPFVVGNWKLNGGLAGNETLLAALLRETPWSGSAACAVCVPFPYLADVAAILADPSRALVWG